MPSRLRSLWRNVVRRSRVERDLDDEVRAAFDLLVEEHVRSGMEPHQARRAATLELGGVESIKSQVREVRAGASWDAFVQDVRYGTRLLWRNPLFALTAVLSLGICIGANTAVFTIANRLLFRDAAGVADPARLVDLAPVRGDGRFGEPVIPYRVYTELRDRATTIEDLYGYQLDVSAVSLRGADGAERVFSTYVTANYFTALGIRPAVGRLFTVADVPGGAPVVVLSHGFWKRRFNGDPAIPGHTLHINGEPLTIVGVAPEGFHGLSVVVADIWLPVSVGLGKGTDPNGVRLAVGGRLREGVTIKQAAAEIDGMSRAIHQDMPTPREAAGGLREDGGGGSLRVLAASPLPAIVRVAVYAFLGVLVGLAGLVLLIACTNIAGVLLARATTRQREIAVRLAMGAGRARLVRQLLTETLLLFLAGGAAGLALARIMTSLVVLALPALPVPVDTSLPLDGRVIGFTALVALVAAVASGLLPSLQASRADVVSALKIGSPTATHRPRLRSAFVVAQVAFSMLLVVGAGLLGRAMQRSGSVALGFDSAAIEVATLDLSLGGYTDRSGQPFIAELLDGLRARAGVSHASVATTLPLGGLRRLCCGVEVPGVLGPDGRPFFEPSMNVVAPGYFETLRIRLVDGRDFTSADGAGSETVAIVSEAAARGFWPGGRAVGQHVVWHKMPSLFARQPGAAMTPPRPTPVPLTVIGVAADIKAGSRTPAPLMYLPFAQHFEPDIAVIARSSSGRRLTAEIRDAVAAANPNLPIIAAFRLADQTSPVLMQLRVTAAVSATLGLVAIFLAAIGIYGLMSYTVTRRTREIGIRLAMGAGRADVVRLVLGQGMLLVLSGSAAGLLIAAGASGLLARLLFGVPPRDPVTFAGAMLLFVAIGIVACYVPVRRAIRIHAMEALRYE